MPSYKYMGCVTAFSENGDNQLIVPNATNTTLNRDDTVYTKRLLQRQLLVDSPDPIVCTPTAIQIDNTVMSSDSVKYYLTLSANDLQAETISVQGSSTMLVSKLIKSAIVQYGYSNKLQVVASDGGGEFWISTPFNQFWTESDTVVFGGVSNSHPGVVATSENHLIIVPTPPAQIDTTGVDLYQYIINAAADKVEIFSCAVAAQIGI